jgi:hypothetical protein
MLFYNRLGLLGTGVSVFMAWLPFYLVGWNWEGFLIVCSSLMSCFGCLVDRAPMIEAWKASNSFVKDPFREQEPLRVALFGLPLIAMPFGTLLIGIGHRLLKNEIWSPSNSFFMGMIASCLAAIVIGYATASRRTSPAKPSPSESPDHSAAIDPSEADRIHRQSIPVENRRRARRNYLFVLLVSGGGLVLFGFSGGAVFFMPAYYLGGFAVGLAILGLLGVNIWKGTTLDNEDH